MKFPMFIEGSAGITGLLIEEHLRKHHSHFSALTSTYQSERFFSVDRELGCDRYELIRMDRVVGASGTNDLCHFDNPGKGASHDAIQSVNVMFGWDEEFGRDTLLFHEANSAHAYDRQSKQYSENRSCR